MFFLYYRIVNRQANVYPVIIPWLTMMKIIDRIKAIVRVYSLVVFSLEYVDEEYDLKR